MTAKPSRPTGVSVLTVLVIIGGLIDLVTAAMLLVLATVSLSWLGILAGLGTRGILLSLVSIGFLISAVVSFILAYGLWNGRSWAWTWTFIFSIIGLIISVFGIAIIVGIVGIIIYAVIIYYLTRVRVKTFFGKAAPPAPPIGVPLPRPVGAPAAMGNFCKHCGMRLAGDEVFCPSCGSRL